MVEKVSCVESVAVAPSLGPASVWMRYGGGKKDPRRLEWARRGYWLRRSGSAYVHILQHYDLLKFASSKYDATDPLKDYKFLSACHSNWDLESSAATGKRARGLGCKNRTWCPTCCVYHRDVLARDAADDMLAAMNGLQETAGMDPGYKGIKVVCTIPKETSAHMDTMPTRDRLRLLAALMHAQGEFLTEVVGTGWGGVIGLDFQGESNPVEAHYHANAYVFPARRVVDDSAVKARKAWVFGSKADLRKITTTVRRQLDKLEGWVTSFRQSVNGLDFDGRNGAWAEFRQAFPTLEGVLERGSRLCNWDRALLGKKSSGTYSPEKLAADILVTEPLLVDLASAVEELSFAEVSPEPQPGWVPIPRWIDKSRLANLRRRWCELARKHLGELPGLVGQTELGFHVGYLAEAGQVYHWMRYLYRSPLFDLWKGWGRGSVEGGVEYSYAKKGKVTKMLLSADGVNAAFQRVRGMYHGRDTQDGGKTGVGFKRVRWYGCLSDSMKAAAMDSLGVDEGKELPADPESVDAELVVSCWKLVEFTARGVILRNTETGELLDTVKEGIKVNFSPKGVLTGKRKRWVFKGKSESKFEI